MFTVYVLKSEHYEKSYVGYTDNLERRLSEHNLGKSNYTSKFKPWRVIYTEKYATKIEALKCEGALKSRSGRRFLKKLFES